MCIIFYIKILRYLVNNINGEKKLLFYMFICKLIYKNE